MTYRYAACPCCGKQTALLKAGTLRKHNDPRTGEACDGSGTFVRRVVRPWCESTFNTVYDWWLEAPESCADFVFCAVQMCSKRPGAKPPWLFESNQPENP